MMKWDHWKEIEDKKITQLEINWVAWKEFKILKKRKYYPD